MRRCLLCFTFLLVAASASAQNPCDTPLTTRAVFPSTATSVPVAFKSPDHLIADKITEYQVNTYAPSNLTTPLAAQVFAKSAATLAPGTPDCYVVQLTRHPSLQVDTDYVVKATARGPAGEADYTTQSNPFVFPSRPVLTGVRVPLR